MGKIDKFICFFIARVIRFFNKNRLLILNYHRVHEHGDVFFTSDMDRATFNWQMYLVSQYFNPLSLNDACEKMNNHQLPKNSIVVTFDDGYKDNIQNAAPILKGYNISATFFIATGFLNGGIMWNDVVIESIKRSQKDDIDLRGIGFKKYVITSEQQKKQVITSSINAIKYLPVKQRLVSVAEINKQCGTAVPTNLMMNDNDIIALFKMGMEIGGHTENHPILKSETDLFVETELSRGKKYLEQLLGATITSFAYPNGVADVDYSSKHIPMVGSAGFTQAVTTNWGLNNSETPCFELFRFTPWDRTPVKFMLRILKLYLFNKV